MTQSHAPENTPRSSIHDGSLHIPVSLFGIPKEYDVYLAHENGNWGPENENSDILVNGAERCDSDKKSEMAIPFLVLEDDEEFKFLIFASKADAIAIWETRQRFGVHVGHRFDYDEKYGTFWFLTSSFPVVRFGEWNQNNTMMFSEDELQHMRGEF